MTFPPGANRAREGFFSFAVLSDGDTLTNIPSAISLGRNFKMKMFLSFLAVLFLLSIPVLAEQPVKGEVRDPSGKLILKTTTRGNRTEVRSPSGKLLPRWKTTNGKTEVRSPSGELVCQSKWAQPFSQAIHEASGIKGYHERELY